MGAVGVAVVQPVIALAVAGILLLTFTAVLGGRASYRQYLAVTTHAMLITTVGALLTVPLQVFSGDLQLRLSLSLLTPFLEPDGAAFRALQGLDVFTLWAVVVLALGVSIVDRKIVDRKHSWPFASAVLLGLYLVIDVGIALAFARDGADHRGERSCSTI